MTTASGSKKKSPLMTAKVLDFYYNWASSPSGFLQLILFIRFAILLIITINFGYIFRDTGALWLKNVTIGVIVFFFLFILYLTLLSTLKPDVFHDRTRQWEQIFVDGMVVAYLYWTFAHIHHKTDPYFFMFYFLPLLVTARFLEFRALALVATFILLASLATWGTEIPGENLFSPQYWFSNLLPQFGILTAMTVFYLIYYRRRKMGERLQTLSLQLEDQLGQLWQGWFSVDKTLCVTGFDLSMFQRHALSTGNTCSQVLCQKDVPYSASCSICPLKKVFDEGVSKSTDMEFIDRNGSKYHAQITVQPILNGEKEVVSVSARVQDLDEQKIYLQKLRMLTEDVERVIDQNRQEDQARVQALARKLEAVSLASESALATDLFRGADEIIRATVSLLDCQLATVRQHHIDPETGQEELLLCNRFGLDDRQAEGISLLDMNSSSLTVKAFKTGDNQHVEDLQYSGLIKYEDFPNSRELHSMACFPLMVQGTPIGTFTLYRNRKYGFTDGDLQLGRALSNIMATLVANQRQVARNQQESQRRTRELEILSDLSHKLVTMNDRDTLAQMVADTVCQELHAETSAIFIRQDELLCRIAISGVESGWFTDEAYQVGEGITGRVALPEAGQMFNGHILENDVENSENVIPGNLVQYSQKLRSGTVRHLLAVPLNGLEGTFGVLRVVNKLDSRGNLIVKGFTEHEVELLTTIACIVAVAMENARSFESEKKNRNVEQALRQSMKILSSTLDEKEILDNILEQLGKIVRYDTSSLFLLEGDGLVLEAMTGFTSQEGETLGHISLDPNINPPFMKMKADHQPILINDLMIEPLLEPIAGTSRIRSWIGAPLVIKNQIIGWLSVDSWEPNKFTRKDVEIAQDFAQQAAIAIDNARQYKLRKEQVDTLLKLDQYLVEITTSTNRDDTMDTIARAASELMESEMAGVALYDKEKKDIHAVPGVGTVGVPQEYVRKFSFPLSRMGGKVLMEKRVYQSNDASTDPDSIFGQRLTEPIHAKGVIAAPLTIGDFIVGVLYAASHSPKKWTDFQSAFFSILSNHAAIAIRNSELFEVKERRAQLLNLLHYMSIAGQLSSAPEVIYNILLTAVTAEYGLRFNRALLMLYDKENGVLRGFTGIGQLERSDAHHIWENLDNKSHNFEEYIRDVLSNGISNYTALHYKAKNLTIPIHADGDEVFSRAFQNRELHVVNSGDELGWLDENFHSVFDVNPFVVVPLVVNYEVVGMLVVDNKFTGWSINKVELELLESCASQAAAAIYRSNLHQQLEERVSVLEHLQELTRAFSELAEPREVLEKISDATIDILHADIAYLAPYDQDKDELLVDDSVTAGVETGFQHEGTFSTHGLTALAKQEPGGLLVIEDLKSRKGLRSRYAEQEDVHSVAVCRLELHKSIVGMLYVNFRHPHRFSGMELNTLRMLAGQAAVAIHNAHLHKQNEILAAQRERNRLREDLHDVLNMFAFKVMEPAESIFEKESRKSHRDLETLGEAEELWRFSRHTYQQLEHILEDMRDPVLVEQGLKVALELLVNQARLPGATLSIQGDVRPSADVELALYRICQEALSNIHKHAGLPRDGKGLCEIVLELESRRSRLFVQDFGTGFATDTPENGKRRMGLQTMKSWARKVGVQIDIRSAPGKGTSLEVIVPVAATKGA